VTGYEGMEEDRFIGPWDAGDDSEMCWMSRYQLTALLALVGNVLAGIGSRKYYARAVPSKPPEFWVHLYNWLEECQGDCH
jgi:hypothetical protein